MAKRVGMWVVTGVLAAYPMLGYAAEHGGKMMSSGSPWTQESSWANQAKGKFCYGLKNVLLGWTELFSEPYEAAKNGGNVAMGIGKGLWNTVGDTVGGALHLVTFPITQIDVPLPEGGTHLL